MYRLTSPDSGSLADLYPVPWTDPAATGLRLPFFPTPSLRR
jgi:hypothetical protein